MSAEPVNEREAIRHKIFVLRQAVNTYLAYGSVSEADRLRNEIAHLERQSQLINEQEKKAREKGE